MKKTDKTEQLPPLIKHGFPFVFAAIMLSGAMSYYPGNYAVLFISTALLAAMHVYSGKKDQFYLKPDEKQKLVFFLFSASVLLLLSRFYRIFTFPADYYSDEWTDIVDLNMKLGGEKPFFAYNVRSGAALPFIPDTVYTAFLVLFRQHLGSLRLIPALLVAATSVELFYLGKTINNRETGIAYMFMYAVSGWTIFTSRELLGNVFIPFFAVLLLLLFILYVKKKDVRLLAGFWAVYLAGFFTYPAWALMAPFSAYLIFEYRKELGTRALKYSAFLLVLLTAVAAAFYLANFSTVSWSAGLTVLGKGSGASDIISNMGHIPVFFMVPLNAAFFTDKLPLLSYAEFLTALGGILVCAGRFRDRTYRILLAGFIISLLSLLISSGIGHQARHILILPFLTMLSGMFLYELFSRRHSIYIITLLLVFFGGVFFYMFVDWNSQLKTDDRDVRIAQHINRTCGDGGCIFMYSTLPYGEYSAYFHSRTAYDRPPAERVKKVAFVTSSLLRTVVLGIFPGIQASYFYDYTGNGTLPLVLYELDVSGDGALRDYLVDLNGRLNYVNMLMWNMKYDDVIDACRRFCQPTDNNLLTMLGNTFLRYHQLKALEIQGRGSEMGEVLLDREKTMFITSEWYLRMAEGFNARGDRKNTMLALQMAVKSAPDWKYPAQVFGSFEKGLPVPAQ
jgi:hypothetical protein